MPRGEGTDFGGSRMNHGRFIFSALQCYRHLDGASFSFLVPGFFFEPAAGAPLRSLSLSRRRVTFMGTTRTGATVPSAASMLEVLYYATRGRRDRIKILAGASSENVPYALFRGVPPPTLSPLLSTKYVFKEHDAGLRKRCRSGNNSRPSRERFRGCAGSPSRTTRAVKGLGVGDEHVQNAIAPGSPGMTKAARAAKERERGKREARRAR